MFWHTFHFQIQHLIHIISLVLKKKKKKKHGKELAPGGGLLNSTLCWTVYTYMGHAQINTQWPLKGH